MRKKSNWHTKEEKRLIRKNKGTPLKKYGYDGIMRGKPVEVRSAKKDKRFQINKKTHKTMVRKRGTYIFKKGSKVKKLPAAKVSKMLGRGKWFYDRGINEHKFLKVKEVMK